MTDEKYLEMQQQVLLFAALICEMDLVGFLNRIEHTHVLAPIVDPTLYREGMGALQIVQDAARALREAQEWLEKTGRPVYGQSPAERAYRISAIMKVFET